MTTEQIIGQDNTKLLEGRQLVTDGELQIDDIIINPNGTHTLVAQTWNYAKACYSIDQLAEANMRVYRKMPVATHLDREPTCPAPTGGPHTPLDVDQLPFAKAKTYDDGKPPLSWLPWKALDEVAMVQAYGHAKYNDFNNFRKGMEVSRNLSCAIRHIRAYMNGETNDPESHRNHLAHATCRLLFVLENIADGTAIDDRYKQPFQQIQNGEKPFVPQQ